MRCGTGGNFHWPFGKIACQQVTCSDPRTSQIYINRGMSSREVFAMSSKLSFSCEDGLELVGEASLTCQPDGKWSSPAPICKCTVQMFEC